MNKFASVIIFGILISCQIKDETMFEKGCYGYDKQFLKKNKVAIIELENGEGNSKILLSADYQGRVITSTTSGDSGKSFGWLNYSLIQDSVKRKQFNPFGGEERFWLGPEGGQFSIYFQKNKAFTMENWQVPIMIDLEKYDVIGQTRNGAVFTKKASFTNYSNTVFNVEIRRAIQMLTKKEIENRLEIELPNDLKQVAYESNNSIKNIGTDAWTYETGALSIWLLGMFTPSPNNVVIIPFKPIKNAQSYITSNYFGEIPKERLIINDSILYFTVDGNFRSKIGLSPKIAKPIAASFDFDNNVLTLVLPEIHQDQPYVNSKWELQKEPFVGDVINSYNDGKLADGMQMGPFFEIESSSPAFTLKPNDKGYYKQSTIHFTGEFESLQNIAKKLLGVKLEDIRPKK